VHDKRLSIVGLCAILACPSDHIPEVVKSGWAQLGAAFSNLFESWPEAVEGKTEARHRFHIYVLKMARLQFAEREQLRKMHENESDDEEDEKAESEGGDEEEVAEDDDEGDVHDEGDEYLDFLASKVTISATFESRRHLN